MKDIMLADTPIVQRAQILRDSCDQIEEKYYTRKFEQEEINDRRMVLADTSIQIAEIDEELKAFRAEIKARMKPLLEEKSKLLQELKSGGEFIKGEAYKFIDSEEGKVAWYTPEGYKLEERDLRADERQRTTFQALRRTGTDN